MLRVIDGVTYQIDPDSGDREIVSGSPTVQNKNVVDIANDQQYGVSDAMARYAGFADRKAYLQHIWPGGTWTDATHYQLPQGYTYDGPAINAPAGWNPKSTGLEKWMPTLIAGLATAGLTGMLPGTTNVFSGLTGAATGGTGAAGGAAAGGAAAGDAAGLTQMGIDAGLSGGALDSFVASGGTMGSTAAGGLGVGTGATTGTSGTTFGAPNPASSGPPIPGAGASPTPWGTANVNNPSLPVVGGGTGGGAGGTTIGGATAATAAGEGALSRILNGSGTADDWAKIAGAVGPGLLNYLGASNAGDAQKDIVNQLRADRAPALNAFNNALNNPNSWYQSAPAMGSVDAILRKLSVQGNPAANPGLLSQAASYNLGGYNDYLKSLSGPAFGTANAETNVNLAGVGSDAAKYSSVGLGLGRLLNPEPSPQETLAKYGITIGGMRL